MMFRSFRVRLYHWVHTSPAVADFVYAAARRTSYVWNCIRFKYISWVRVSPEELRPHRFLVPNSTLMLNVTNICNARCSFCAYPKVVDAKTLPTGVMSVDVFKKAADEWAAAGGKDIDLTPVVGDPLVDPKLFDKIDYLVQHAKLTGVHLTTNGILLNRNKNYERLVDHGVTHVYISTQGTDKETYETVYGVKQYDEVISGVRHLLEYNQSKGEPMQIVIRFRNAQRPSEIIRSPDFQRHIKPFLSERVRHNFTVAFDNWGGTIHDGDMHGDMHLRKLPPPINVPCTGLFGFAVRHDGHVRMCGCRLIKSDMDDLVAGDCKEQSLQEISSSDRAWKIIEGFYQGRRPETCQGCTFYNPITRGWFKHRSAWNTKPRSTEEPSNPAPAKTTPAAIAKI